eukprot:2902495-Amphidinium_carterae.1
MSTSVGRGHCLLLTDHQLPVTMEGSKSQVMSGTRAGLLNTWVYVIALHQQSGPFYPPWFTDGLVSGTDGQQAEGPINVYQAGECNKRRAFGRHMSAQIVITGRRARLEAAQREAVHGNKQDPKRLPKAPPAGMQAPPPRKTSQTTSTSSTQQLRENVQRSEERLRLNAGGYYVSPPGPNYQRDKERLAKFEAEEKQQRLLALSAQEAEEERQRLQAYVERLEAEAAQQGVPEE